MSIITKALQKKVSWAKPKLFYKHELQDLSASSSAAGYDVKNVLNRLETTKWLAEGDAHQTIYFDAGTGKTITADYLAIHGHNLTEAGANVVLQYSNDNFGSDINNAFTAEIPSRNTYVKEFAPISERHWRLSMSGASMAPRISMCYWGETDELDYCENDFDPNGFKDMAVVNISQTGYILGVYERYKERFFTLSWPTAEADLYAKIKELIETVGRQNFVIAWETEDHTDDVFLVYADATFNNPYNKQGRYRNVRLKLKGRI